MSDKKDLAVNNDRAVAALSTQDNNTGMDEGAGIQNPKTLKIYQSELQDVYFDPADCPTKKDYGKVFLYQKDVLNTTADLKESIEGTLLRMNNGFIVYVPKEGKPKQIEKWIGSGYGTIGVVGVPMTKEAFAEKYPDYTAKNRVRLLLALGNTQEAVEAAAFGGNPLFEILLQGTSYGVSFGIHPKKDAALSKDLEVQSYMKENGLTKLPACAYKLIIGSETEVDPETKKVYYVPKIDVQMNTVKGIVEIRPLFDMFLNYKMFGDMAEHMKQAQSADELPMEETPLEPGDVDEEGFPVMQAGT